MILRNVLVGKKKIILKSKLTDEFALSATVAFAKGVQGIDFGKVICEALSIIANWEIS